ncbi:replication protein A 70 kDa DNA-binding subunit B [Tanacetum coccineum]
MPLVNQFKHQLEKGKNVTLQRYSLGKIQPKYHMVNKALCLSFLSNTDVEICNDFTGSLYGFDFRSYNTITQLHQKEDAFLNIEYTDVIGDLVACEDHDNYDKNGKEGKKPLTLVDAEYAKCVFKMDIMQQNSSFSMAPRHSLMSKSIVKGTIIAIHEEEGWWYISCKVCKKKVIRSSDMVDPEAEIPKKKYDDKDDWFCTKCNVVTNTKRFLRLSDDSEIIESIRPKATSIKDLKSHTDENTTPVNTGKIIDAPPSDKHDAEEDISSDSSNCKKRTVEVKIEKDA